MRRDDGMESAVFYVSPPTKPPTRKLSEFSVVYPPLRFVADLQDVIFAKNA